MYLVKVYVDKSSIHGLGVFAGEDIPKGTVIWKLEPAFDHIYTQEEFDRLPQQAQDYLNIYAYWEHGRIIHCGDCGIYVNHSDSPNVGNMPDDVDREIALYDIKKGEEITSDYRTFDDISKKDLGKVLGAAA